MNHTLIVQPYTKLGSIFFMPEWDVAVSFSFFVLFEQSKVLLPLVCAWIPTKTDGFKAPLVRFVQLALLEQPTLCIDPIAKLHPILFMRLRCVDVTFLLLVLFK